jgi:hypothetical protein
MFNKILLPFLILFLLPVFVNAQEVKPPKESNEKVYYLHNGKFTPKEVVEKYEKPRHNDNLHRNRFGDVYLSPDDLEDTLGNKPFYPPAYLGFNFGMFGQDRMIQWVEAPADMRIISVGMMCVEKDDTTNGAASMKLVEFAWTMDQIENLGPGAHYLGYYEATGNGYNDATAYLDDVDRTGGWVDSSGVGLTSPFGNDLWSDGGVGFPFIPFLDLSWANGGCRTPDCMDEYNWVDMDILFEPEVLRFDIIGISTKNLDPIPSIPPNPDPLNRIGWYAGDADLSLPHAFKFYQGGRLDPAAGLDFGWWAREWTWDYVLAVVLTGDTPPDINSFTQLTTTLSTAPRTVDANITDENPAGGGAGVDVAKIVYSTDGGVTWLEVIMTGTEPDYTGDIPGMPGGTEVTYRIEATDVGGNTSTTMPVVYFVFGVENGTNLVILNGFDMPTGFPQDYYFGADVQSGTTTFPHDVWSYGPVESALLDNYTNVFEIWNADEGDYNNDIVRAWLEGDGNRNYFLAGQEYLGANNQYTDSTYEAGSFEYDIWRSRRPNKYHWR